MMGEGESAIWGLLGIGAAIGTSMFMSSELRKQVTEEINKAVREAKKYASESSYIIYKEGDIVCAKNSTTGQVEFSGSDATEVIQSAINALVNGGRIFIKRGVYTLTCKTTHDSERVCISLAGKRNIEIVGEGSGTVLRLADNQNATIISLYNGARFNRIMNIRFDGNKENNPEVEAGVLHPNGVNIRLNSNHNIVQDCIFENITAHPILIITTSHRNLIIGNYFENNDWYDVAASGDSIGNVVARNVISNSIGLESFLGSNTVFAENTIYSSPRAGATALAVSSIISDGNDIIAYNMIVGSYRTGIRSSMDTKPNTIIGNVIIDPCKGNVDNDAGILVYGSNKLVEGNIVVGSSQRGIYVRGNGNVITGNFVTGSARQNILLHNVNGNRVTANIVYNGSIDIHVDSGSDNVIESNYVSGSSASPIILISGDRHVISGNVIKDVNSIAVSLFGTGAIYVERNLLANVNAGSVPNGSITVNVGASGKVIRGNILYGSGAAGIVIRGNDCIAEGNYVTGFTGVGILDYSAQGSLIRGNRVLNNGSFDIRLYASTGAIVVDNDVRGSTSTRKISDEGTGNIIRRNLGFVTENSGIVIIPAGSTYVDVNHFLDITPSPERIRVIPLTNLAGKSFWVSDITSTTFRINISSADTVDHEFGWNYD